MEQHQRNAIASGRWHDSGGFSLVEIMFALWILLVVAAGMATLFGVSKKANDTNSITVQLLNSARAKVEQIQSIPYDQVGINASGTASGPGYFVVDPIYNPVYDAANGDAPLSDTVTIKGGIQVTRTVTVAAVDDAADGTGSVSDLDGLADPNTGTILDYKLLTVTASATLSGQVITQSLTTILQGALPNEEEGSTGVEDPGAGGTPPAPTKMGKAPTKVPPPTSQATEATESAGCNSQNTKAGKSPGKKGASSVSVC